MPVFGGGGESVCVYLYLSETRCSRPGSDSDPEAGGVCATMGSHTAEYKQDERGEGVEEEREGKGLERGSKRTREERMKALPQDVAVF